MASKGPQISTSSMDGQDHSFRQRIATHYQISTLNKSRLKYCIFFHYFLFFAMLAKLVPCILDWFNVFILDIEELEVPEPYLWEWIWLSSLVVSFFCLDAIKKSNLSSLQYYMMGLVLFGYLPLVYAILFWFPDVWVYLMSDEYANTSDIVYWKEYPYGLLWYAFILLALQVHSFSMYFSYNLMTALKSRGTRKAD